jgi:hypothetical protein
MVLQVIFHSDDLLMEIGKFQAGKTEIVGKLTVLYDFSHEGHLYGGG